MTSTETDMEPKYPDIEVELSDMDGNVFAIIGRTSRALRRGGVSKEERDEFSAEAMSGGYDHALQTVMAWVDTV